MSRVHFADAEPSERHLLHWLDTVEQQRYRRFLVDRAREEFLAGRLLLRRVLAGELACAPAAVPIRVDDDGKPRVAGHERLCFNLSHSDRRVLLALDDQPIGCDLQRIDPGVESDRLAQRWLQPEEAATVRAITDPAYRRRSFFQAWTMKEAVVKATGAGFAQQAGSFVVDPLASGPQLIRWRAEAWLSAAYRIHPLMVGADFVASVVAASAVEVCSQ